jgi:hypothetical protein
MLRQGAERLLLPYQSHLLPEGAPRRADLLPQGQTDLRPGSLRQEEEQEEPALERHTRSPAANRRNGKPARHDGKCQPQSLLDGKYVS